MLTVKSNPLELRGIAHKETRNGKQFYQVNCETQDGTPYGFYCPSASAFSPNLKKGDEVCIVFEVAYFQGKERLIVQAVEKAV